MEFDLINDMISDTLSRFFSNDSQIQVIDDFKGLFSSSSSVRKTSSSIQLDKSSSLSSQIQQQQSFSSHQSFKNLETSPFISKETQSLPQQTSSMRVQSASILSSANSSNSTNLGYSNNANNGADSQKFNHVAQRNNLFDSSNQPLTPELWIQKEGPNKLKEAQQRLNLNLSRVSRSDLEQMSLDQLASEKKKVKQELKMYDASFQTHFNRFPYYKKLKQFMAQKGQISSVNDDNDDNSSSRQRVQQAQPLRQQNGTSSSSTATSLPLSDQQQAQLKKQIEEIKKVRAELRDKLHIYQSEFFKNHNRRIRYHKDILPVENEYKQYKDTKQELLRLESLISK